MFMTFGTPTSLNEIDIDPLSIKGLKEKFEILIIDDNPPPMLETLKRSGFRVRDLQNIETIETVEPYPIVACDIQGIGTTLRPGDPNGGLHVLSEIRKYYPDKYLIQYSTKLQPIASSLNKADVIFPKDTPIGVWQDTIEKTLKELGNPKKRWIKVRTRLSTEGLDAFKILQLEQAYIKNIQNNNAEKIDNPKLLTNLSPEAKKLIINFAATTLSMGIKELMKP
ncbi:hypothetical protein O4O02_23390 [Pseudomonas fortuita]|uniref:hypothetical protein n=1 Tax=Pseudomonas fortuita TaxID=3233375 RepID=UPI003D81758F